jgi:AbrB family looped-hinge helix DNA binding protein
MMKRLLLKVDSKGRIQIPKKIRERLRIGDEVSATIDDKRIIFEPTEHILDRLAKEVKFNFKSVHKDMPKLRKAAERELLKQVS